MQPMLIPRPDDFRLAWPNAYSEAMRLAIEIQNCNDLQIKVVNSAMEQCIEFSDKQRDNLRKTGNVYVAEMRKAGEVNKQSIEAATVQFSKTMNAHLCMQRDLKDEIRQGVESLLKERQRIEKLKFELNSRPLWKRLWLACFRAY